jgi:hypothetical protein
MQTLLKICLNQLSQRLIIINYKNLRHLNPLCLHRAFFKHLSHSRNKIFLG